MDDVTVRHTVGPKPLKSSQPEEDLPSAGIDRELKEPVILVYEDSYSPFFGQHSKSFGALRRDLEGCDLNLLPDRL